jgi:hypothetical protein
MMLSLKPILRSLQMLRLCDKHASNNDKRHSIRCTSLLAGCYTLSDLQEFSSELFCFRAAIGTRSTEVSDELASIEINGTASHCGVIVLQLQLKL